MGLENPVLIKFYIRRVLATGYVTINFIKFLKGSRSTRDRILNINSKKKIREYSYCKLEKRRRNEERLSLTNPQK